MMFGRKQPKWVPPTEKHTHHHYSQSRWPEIFGPLLLRGMALVAVVSAISWLASLKGHDQPIEAGLWAALVVAAFFILWPKVEQIADKFFEHNLQRRELELRYSIRQQVGRPLDLTLRHHTPTEDRLHRLCEIVLVEAYAKGKFEPGESRPWSRRPASKFVLTGEGDKPVGPNLAEQVRPLLVKHRLIVGAAGHDQLNFRRYPSLELALAELSKPWRG